MCQRSHIRTAKEMLPILIVLSNCVTYDEVKKLFRITKWFTSMKGVRLELRSEAQHMGDFLDSKPLWMKIELGTEITHGVRGY